MHELPQNIQDKAREVIKDIASKPTDEQDLELLNQVIGDYITDEGRKHLFSAWTIPCQAINDYQARRWLGKLMNTMRKHGYIEHERTAA